MIPIALGFIVLATGIGMLLSRCYVRFRDVQPIWDVSLQAWFYALADHVLGYRATDALSPPGSSDSR